MRKKGVLEVLDEALVKDTEEVIKILDRMDRGFYEKSAKKPGRPTLYIDDFHIRLRERVRRHRANHV